MKMSEEFISTLNPSRLDMNYLWLYKKHQLSLDREEWYEHFRLMTIYDNMDVIKHSFEQYGNLFKVRSRGRRFASSFSFISLDAMKLSVKYCGRPQLCHTSITEELPEFYKNTFDVFKYVFDLYTNEELEGLIDTTDEQRLAYFKQRGMI